MCPGGLQRRLGRQREPIQLIALLETDNAVIEAAASVSQALDWYQQGADFADALHLSACGGAVMHTFDLDVCKAARNANNTPAVPVW